MFLFGVTGGIGCGKSVVCQFLKEKDVPIIEADPLAKDLTNRLPEIRRALTEEFGADIYISGSLNVEKMSQLIFSDAAARTRVNQIIHPHVVREILHQAQRLASDGHKLIGVEAALIYESTMQKMLNAVIVVSAPLEKRIEWIQKRNHLSRSEILQRIASQMPLSEKIQLADYVIENDGTLQQLAAKVDTLYSWLLEK